MTAPAADAGPRLLIETRTPIIGFALLSVAIGFLYCAVATDSQPTHSVVWGSLALAAYSSALLCMVSVKRATNLGLANWSLGSWTLLWYGAAFGLATVTWSRPQSGTPAEITLSSVLEALWLVAVGMSFWALGYSAGAGQLIRRWAGRLVERSAQKFGTEVRSRAAPWILYTIGMAARLASTATTGRFGYVGDASSAVSSATSYGAILDLLSLCAPLAVAAAALQVYRERLPGARITLVMLFLAELAFGAAAGGKQNFIIAVLAVAIPFTAERHRLPKAAFIGLILIFLVVVIPFNQAYRSAARSSVATLSDSQAIGAAPGIIKETLTGHKLLTVLPSSLGYLLQRIREIDSPAIIIQRTPAQIGYINPVELVEAPVAAVVPRALWPSKPILASGYQMSQVYYGLPSTVYTSSAITPVGDLYRYGGWMPVIAGMFLFGTGVRLLDDILDLRSNPQAIFLILLFFPTLVKDEVGWVQLLAEIPSTILVWLLAVSLTFRARKAA